CADGAVAKEDVVRALGSLEEERLVELFDALIQKDAKGALLVLHRVLEGGTDPSLFMEKLLEHVRNLLFLRVSESLQELVDATESYKKEILRQSQSFAREELFYGFSVISHTLQVMKRFEMKHIPLEMALVKLAARAPVEDASLILQKLKALEKKTKPAEKQGREIEKEKVSPEVKEEEADRDETSDVDELEDRDFSAKEVLREKKFLTVGAVWPSLLQALQGEKISVASYLAEGSPCGLDNGSFKIAFPDRLSFHRECLETVENRTLIEKHLSNLLEQRVRVVFESVKEEGGAASGPAVEAPAEPEEPDGVVQKAIGLFGGRVIKS
ncbi:MAG: hypothetical protein HY593_01830, partial [Candidatus Omnitrophica bacterium]|nr:hypothetical protein [Candidatus Omnitrophota bacterium]